MESFLETAGFSRDNPYYMVEQGSVKQLCELSDEGRLRLLKEVAGTRVYEERRRESESILEDTKLKVAQVRDLIDEMNHSLQVELGQRVHTQELETEKEALEEYEQYDRERRICVYFLASTDIREKEEGGTIAVAFPSQINRCNVNRKTLADQAGGAPRPVRPGAGHRAAGGGVARWRRERGVLRGDDGGAAGD